ncbi:ubiquitin carboxyl-terminal hydrolase MINDY-3-like [Haliotis rubra]|uniref:ubiquitin carboxyl-terminal hydrolase MINDY-3-like n=1 Tax=Haliotis rubra TaxID=36100 RepID=UPI001EE5CE66|nr:ubiquitin carboxyl-terminal hydrolase MINDY-3-like [Haliotis rubra]
MASTEYTNVDCQSVSDLQALLWGVGLKDEVFSRWTQGLVFSDDEATALIQYEGGPCAVIAPVQAYLLKRILFSPTAKPSITDVTGEEASEFLFEALLEMVSQVAQENYTLVCMDDCDLEAHTSAADSQETGQRSPKRRKLDQETFHAKLKCIKCTEENHLRISLKKLFHQYQGDYGVLLYLYSILLTKGIQQVKNEVEDPSEALIDGTYGHGSQSLINLLLTGKAISNVWDNDKDVSGLRLQGIKKQSPVGFLTLLEHLRYCEVGWFLKNPKYPIWILGSETHLTVLFTKEQSLVTQESPELNAKHIFSRYDPEGNGFISTSMLDEVLSALDLVSEKEYVDIMKTKLDAENLGIITQHSFMQEFFPGQVIQDVPRNFTLFHYNGLARSCSHGKVVYQEASVRLEDELEVQIVTDTSPVKCCLQTKWPTIELTWKSGYTPSLN